MSPRQPAEFEVKIAAKFRSGAFYTRRYHVLSVTTTSVTAAKKAATIEIRAMYAPRRIAVTIESCTQTTGEQQS